MSNNSLQSFHVFNRSSPAFTTEYTASCPGKSFATRIDFEAMHLAPSVPVWPYGFLLHCSDGSPALPVNYHAGKSVVNDYDVEQSLGPLVASGIRDVSARHGGMLSQFGYGGVQVPLQVGAGFMGNDVWRQSESMYAACVLKGLSVWVNAYGIFSLRFDFTCPPTTPASTTTISTESAPSGLSIASSTSPLSPPSFASSATNQLASSTGSSLTSTQSAVHSTPVPTPITTTITLVGSNSVPTTIVTVITPGAPLIPLTVTLGGGHSTVILTQIPGATTFTTLMPAFSQSAPDWTDDIALLLILIIAMSLATAAAAAALVYVRMRPGESKQDEGSGAAKVAVELADLGGPVRQEQLGQSQGIGSHEGVPPVYLVVEVAVPGLVEERTGGGQDKLPSLG
ncbi:hypothetical protein BCR44DRAFT_96215 [Catenaria anguillulae PL171]|uniref:Uncharacterized protein n=1 Tax=Catenaria anguillulae PL171 TaxID=765915 RepID=A0A1Y2I6I5_9FUNG|nr:hypothetical protein BCR44DRAFT_96215 [Catenaria anguillulae PL171]